MDSEALPFRGPLGLWPWPLVNLILAFALSLARGARGGGSPRTRVYQLVRDDKGRIVEIVEVER